MQKKEEEDKGISWGMADDAVEEEEETDFTKPSPFAQTDESLYLDDPKKTLRGWFEREGLDQPEYKCEEKGFATFTCKVDLPIDGVSGGSMVAEVTTKGKKKEAVIQCALEACRILDRHGMLRQANHESRASKLKKKWEDDDFYDSDEDEFLDRTGSISAKRQKRMMMAGKEDAKQENVDTYESLLEKSNSVKADLEKVEKELEETRNLAKRSQAGEDDLDAYMENLKGGGALDKETLYKLKQKSGVLQKELLRLQKLIEIAKPTSLPKLESPAEKKQVNKMSGILIGKRKGGFGKMRSIQVQKEQPKPIPQVEPETVQTSESVPKVTESKPSLESDLNASNTEEENKSQNSIPQEPTQVENITKPIKPETEIPKPQPDLKPEEKSAPKPPKRKRQGQQRPAKPIESHDNDSENEDEKVIGKEYSATSDPKYDVWMPPEGQTGDGRTALNDKLGY